MANRALLGFGALTLATGAAFASAFGGVFVAYGTCDGDGGDPFSAPDSVAGRFCESSASTVYFWAELVVPVLVVLAFGMGGIVVRRWRPLLVGFVASLTTVALMDVVVLALPDRCSAEQEADGADCATY
jgi:hypothetical protein